MVWVHLKGFSASPILPLIHSAPLQQGCWRLTGHIPAQSLPACDLVSFSFSVAQMKTLLFNFADRWDKTHQGWENLHRRTVLYVGGIVPPSSCEGFQNHWARRLLETSRRSQRVWRGDKLRGDAHCLPQGAPLGPAQPWLSLHLFTKHRHYPGTAAIPHPSLVISHFSYAQNHLAVDLTSYIALMLHQTQLITGARKLVPDVN